MITIKKISILTLLILLNINLFATNDSEINSNESKYQNEFKKEIRSLIKFPEFAKQSNLEGFVLVQFTYDKTGKINILEINSNQPDLKNYVSEQLESLKMCEHAQKSDKKYSMRFDFKLL